MGWETEAKLWGWAVAWHALWFGGGLAVGGWIL